MTDSNRGFRKNFFIASETDSVKKVFEYLREQHLEYVLFVMEDGYRVSSSRELAEYPATRLLMDCSSGIPYLISTNIPLENIYQKMEETPSSYFILADENENILSVFCRDNLHSVPVVKDTASFQIREDDAEVVLRNIFDGAMTIISEPCVLSDWEGNILAFNPSLKKFLKLEDTQRVRTSLFYADPAERQSVLEELKCFGRVLEKTFKGKRSDGALFKTVVSAITFKWNNKSYIFTINHEKYNKRNIFKDNLLTLNKDIFDNRKVLIQKEKMSLMGKMIEELSNEITNPNHVILLNCTNISNSFHHLFNKMNSLIQDPSKEKIHKMTYQTFQSFVPRLIEDIKNSAVKIKNIIDGLTSFCQSNHGFQTISINNVIRTAKILLSHFISKHTHQFDIVYGQNIPLIKADFQQLEHVLIHLIQNACQSLRHKNKKIRLSSSYDPGLKEILVQVADEGRGIPKDILPKVREPFFTTDKKNMSSGLGLFVSEIIIQEHQGKLEIESEPGRGTIVTIRLPGESYEYLK